MSNQRRRYCDGGLVAEIEAVRHPDGRMSYSLEAVPVWVAMPGYRVVPSEVGDTMALPEAYALVREDVAEVLGGAYKYKQCRFLASCPGFYYLCRRK